MAAAYIQVTNQTAAHVFAGASVLITLSSTESVSKLPLLSVGMKCTLGSNSNVGYISSVDAKGHSFRIQPTSKEKTIDGIGSNNVTVGEIIQIQLS